MKKKGTRKIRKNKRATQRRKNRSYKRMRGGMFKYKELSKKTEIPADVTQYMAIEFTILLSQFKNSISEIKKTYEEAIDTTNPDNDVFYSTNTATIKKYMTRFTQDTQEEVLTAAPISIGTTIPDLIKYFITWGFLPSVHEFEELYNKFYGIKQTSAEKDTKHNKPFKFNGFALAVSLVVKLVAYKKITQVPQVPQVPQPDMPPSFGELQSYLFELGSTANLFWKTIPTGTPVTANPVCPLRDRIRYIKYGESESPVTYKNIYRLKYVMKACEPKDAGPLLSSCFTVMNRSAEQGTAIKPGETTSVTYKLHVAPDTLPPDGDKFSEPKYKMYVSRIEIKYIDMTDFENKSKIDCPPMSSYIQVTVITIYEYDEDGMINKVLVTYKFFLITKPSLEHCKSLTDRYGKIINLNELVYREVVTDMETKLKLRVRPSKTLGGMLEHDTFIPINITAKRGDTYTPARPLVYTLYMTHTPHTDWTAQHASVIQNNAFNAVNDYIQTHEWTMSNPVKRFLIENGEADKISVVIEVNELTAQNTLKRATYCGEEMSEYELFDTQENAQINAAAKLANYNWTTANGPIGF